MRVREGAAGPETAPAPGSVCRGGGPAEPGAASRGSFQCSTSRLAPVTGSDGSASSPPSAPTVEETAPRSSG